MSQFEQIWSKMIKMKYFGRRISLYLLSVHNNFWGLDTDFWHIDYLVFFSDFTLIYFSKTLCYKRAVIMADGDARELNFV